MSAVGAPLVDAHHHVWDVDRQALPWLGEPGLERIRRTFTVDDLRAAAAGTGLAASVVVQTESSSTETRDLLALAERDPLVAGVVGWVDLTAPSVRDDLAALLEGPGGRWLRGVRHQVQDEPDDGWIARPDVLRGLAAVRDAGLACDLLTRPHQLPAAIRAVRAVPGLTFVLDHCSKPAVATGAREPWATRLRELAAEPGVVCKLSGLVTEADPARWQVADLAPYLDVVLAAFGPERLAFGSDWPVCLVAATYERWLEAAQDLLAPLSAAERQAVFAGTATRAYRLTGRGPDRLRP